MMDADMKEIMECFSASPVSADIDVARLWRAIQSIRREEREACVRVIRLSAESWKTHPLLDDNNKQVVRDFGLLAEAAILQRGE